MSSKIREKRTTVIGELCDTNDVYDGGYDEKSVSYNAKKRNAGTLKKFQRKPEDLKKRKKNWKHEKTKKGKTSDSDISLCGDFKIMLSRLIGMCHKKVQKEHRLEWKEKLRSNLLESRDNILARAREKRQLARMNAQIVDLIPSNSCDDISPLSFFLPKDNNDIRVRKNANPKAAIICTDATQSPERPESTTITREKSKCHDKGITFKFRKSNGSQYSQTIEPSLYLEGTHQARPPHTATVFLRSHFFTEDEQNLTYVPYFGDDDKEDVVSDVFDINKREEMLKKGPDYQASYISSIIDEIIKLFWTEYKEKRFDRKFIYKKDMIQQEFNDILATFMHLDSDRIHDRHCIFFENESMNGFREDEQNKTGDSQLEQSGTYVKKNSNTKTMVEYQDLMDSYRNLFCRRCFTYDCNFHGNLEKPDIELQGELALAKEREGHWDKLNLSYGQCIPIQKEKNESIVDSNLDSSENENENDVFAKNSALDPFQKSACKRIFQIFQGDIWKIAKVIGAHPDVVKKFIAEQDYKLNAPKHLDSIIMKLKQKKSKGKYDKWSMRNYNPKWLQRIMKAEIHPAFQPCNHTGPCSESNCSCVQNSYFCTKHCVLGEKSKNFFRGCNCKSGCNTNACPCFAAGRECDPDLCHSCGAGTDPPNARAVAQLCRNDNIGMRRHAHLLLAESSIKDAGWGIYTKYALKKGDYVHEYIGEVISQEEAERRGRVYDKVNRSYLFNLTSDFVVDASRKGNKTRFINHSSKPNCRTKMMNVNGDIRIGLYAQEDIEPQTEVRFLTL